MDRFQSSGEARDAAVCPLPADRPWSRLHDCRNPGHFPSTRADNAFPATRGGVLRACLDDFLQCALEPPLAGSADSSMAGEPQHDSASQDVRDSIDRRNLQHFDCDRRADGGRQDPCWPRRIVVGCLPCKGTEPFVRS